MKTPFGKIKIILQFLIFAFILIAVWNLNAKEINNVFANGNENNITGWGWSDNIGWISFNCENTNSCNYISYGVKSDNQGNVSGYAWSDNIGWISFNKNDVSGCPSGTCKIKITGSSVDGWAKALSADANGWDGWINLKTNPSYGISYTQQTGFFSGYAWGSNVVGWVDFGLVSWIGGQNTVQPIAPIILSPAGTHFNTSTILFSGLASSTLTVLNDFSNSTTTADLNENWSLNIDELAQGTTTIKFFTSNINGTSSSTEKTIFVDTVAPTFTSFNIQECAFSLEQSRCLLADNFIILSWETSDSDILLYHILKDGIEIATTTKNQYSLNIFGGTYDFRIIAKDFVGNTTLSMTKTVEIIDLPGVGFFCQPYTSTFLNGDYYIPTGSICTYQRHALGNVKAYGDVYKGTIGNSIILNGHSLGIAVESIQNDSILSSLNQGDNIFIVMYENRLFSDDIVNFRNYFTNGSVAPPHFNYGIIKWKFGN